MAEFRIPIRILYGDGTLEHISGLRGDRMLLVHDCEAACRIAQKQARRTGMHIRVFSVPEGPVDGPTVLEGAKALMEFKPGWIIAIGGHAAMDCAKLMRIFYERPDLTPDDLVRSDIPRMKLGRTRLIAVPTLGSNGGEATGYAALWNPRRHNRPAAAQRLTSHPYRRSSIVRTGAFRGDGRLSRRQLFQPPLRNAGHAYHNKQHHRVFLPAISIRAAAQRPDTQRHSPLQRLPRPLLCNGSRVYGAVWLCILRDALRRVPSCHNTAFNRPILRGLRRHSVGAGSEGYSRGSCCAH